MAGKRHTQRSDNSPNARVARSAASGAAAFSAKNPTNLAGWRLTAAATDSSSPGMLPISAARETWLRSSSAIHRSASDSVGPGASIASSVATSEPDTGRVPLTFSLPSASKNRFERKWQWPSLTFIAGSEAVLETKHRRYLVPHAVVVKAEEDVSGEQQLIGQHRLHSERAAQRVVRVHCKTDVG